MKKRLRKKVLKRKGVTNPGLKEILEHYSATKPLTVEGIKEYFMDILKSKESQKSLVIGQYCATQGFIERRGEDLKLCTNPDCASCSAFWRELKKAG